MEEELGLSSNSDNYDNNGQINLQEFYDLNSNNLDQFYSDENKSETYLRSSINNHFWYGLLSTVNYKFSDSITISGGLDYRYYKGEHYREVYDLLGGDYAIDDANGMQVSQVKRKGDKVGYNNDGYVKWIGGFSQLEYSDGKISSFINLSAANSAYKRIDHFKKKDLVLEDTTFVEALGTSVNTTYIFDENGSNYRS